MKAILGLVGGKKMLALEIKIILLTLTYFIGWFLFEKVFSEIWERIRYKETVEPKKHHISKITPIGAVTPLDQTARYIRGLKHPDWRVRRIACIQLGEKRGSAVVQALVEALNDPREEVSLAAGEALAKIGDPAAIATLTEHVQRLEKKTFESYERYRAA